jgi:chromate reductase
MSIRVLGVVGSLRAASYNGRLLAAAIELAPPELSITPHSLGDVPLYNADIQAQGEPPAIVALRAAVHDAGAMLIASPEYNFGAPGVLKNAIDWISRPPATSPLARKPVAIMGASQGVSGTMRMQLELRLTLQSVGTYTMPKPEIVVTHCKDKFDAEGRLTDANTREHLARFLAAFVEWTRRF